MTWYPDRLIIANVAGRSAGPQRPLDAWDGKHWCGAIMPVRVA